MRRRFCSSLTWPGNLVNICFANENKLNTSLMRGLICGLRCRKHPDKAKCSKKAMFIDSYTHKSWSCGSHFLEWEDFFPRCKVLFILWRNSMQPSSLEQTATVNVTFKAMLLLMFWQMTPMEEVDSPLKCYKNT